MVAHQAPPAAPPRPRRRLGCLPKLIIWSLVIGFLYWLLFAPIPLITSSSGSQVDLIDGELSSEQQAGYKVLAGQSSEPPRVVAKEGAVRFLSVGVQILDSVAASPTDKAMYFLEQNQSLFQIEDVRRSFRLLEVLTVGNGDSYVKYVQEFQGVPVYGSSITVGVSANGEVNVVNGGYVPNLEMDIMPSISSQEAENTSLADFNSPDGQVSSPTELIIYSTSVWGEENVGPPRLAWIVHIASRANPKENHAAYIIDAGTGEVINRSGSSIDVGGSLQVLIFDADGSPATTLESTLAISETETNNYRSENVSPEAEAAYDHIHRIYDFFWEQFRRDSFDGTGRAVYVIVDVDDGTGCNASTNYSGEERLTYIALCDGHALTIDPIAHEFGHFVFITALNLETQIVETYRGETASLNEGYADLFAVFLDDGNPWFITADNYTIRNLADPPGEFPRRYADKREDCPNDTHCAHTNSVIFTHAARLMHQSGVPVPKLQHIFYHALTSGKMNGSTDLKSAANIVRESCETLADDISFNPDISENDCQAVTEAFIETGLLPAPPSELELLLRDLWNHLVEGFSALQQRARDFIDRTIGDLRQRIEDELNNLWQTLKQKLEEGIQSLIQWLINLAIDAINQFFIQLCGVPCLPAYLPAAFLILRLRRRRKPA